MEPSRLAQTRLLRAEEVAHILNIGRATVYVLCREGKLPSVRIGSSVRIPADALSHWLESHTSLPEEI